MLEIYFNNNCIVSHDGCVCPFFILYNHLATQPTPHPPKKRSIKPKLLWEKMWKYRQRRTSPSVRRSDSYRRNLSPFAQKLIKSAKKRNGNKKSEKISKQDERRSAEILLEHKLGAQRPSLKELKKNNLIHSDHQAHHAPAIAKKMKTLQRKFREDALHQKFRERPTRNELHQKGILHSKHRRSSMDPVIVMKSKQLENAFKKDLLNRTLKNRPKPKDLHKSGILHIDHHRKKIDHSLIGPIAKLTKAFKHDHLNRRLAQRPSKKTLHKKNILSKDHGKSGSHKIHKTSKDLDRAFKKDKLHQQFRNRKPLMHLHRKGIVDKRHPQFQDHPEISGAGKYVSENGDLDIDACVSEVHRALENMRALKAWLSQHPR